jgi:hypothetical protein
MNRPNVSATLKRVHGSVATWLNPPNPSTALVAELLTFEAYRWLVRDCVPTWLAAAGLTEQAQTLRTKAVPVELAEAIRAAAVVDATAAVCATDLHDTATGVEIETAAQQAIDATDIALMVAAVWADETQRDSDAWDVWDHLGEAVYAAATAVAVRAAAADPDNAVQAAKAALAGVVARLRRSAGPLLGLHGAGWAVQS